MLRLGLDTSTRLGSVAVGRDAELLAETTLSVRASHSETLLPEADHLLERCGLGPADLDEVVVGAGPGSFTGVRISASLAKGLCASTGAGLRAYSSLAAVAAGTGVGERVSALLDARGEEVYAAAWEDPGRPEPTSPPAVTEVAELAERLGPGWTHAGPGARSHRATLEAAGGRVLPPPFSVPRGGALLALAVAWPEAGRVEDPAGWEPEYVRGAGAERGV